eukprot:c20542_g2_i2.p1 GENE.c20542_g2_i2~~c20542_g2_i2.p1  ORF type:complete len:115 (-),score=18.71 c20542_g2_i2:161-505(-)
MRVCEWGRVTAVEVLIGDGETGRDVALEMSHTEIVALLDATADFLLIGTLRRRWCVRKVTKTSTLVLRCVGNDCVLCDFYTSNELTSIPLPRKNWSAQSASNRSDVFAAMWVFD